MKAFTLALILTIGASTPTTINTTPTESGTFQVGEECGGGINPNKQCYAPTTN